jgi:uncharacterized protein (DUF1684 family)
MTIMKSLVLPIAACLWLTWGCDSRPRPKANPHYLREIQAWHQSRIEGLKSPAGWLNLAGLFWLKAGENTAGADSANAIIFPKAKAPAFIGAFVLQDSIVKFQARPGVSVTHNDSAVTTIIMRNDLQENPTKLMFGTLSWTIIKRGGRYGVRLRDLEHPQLQQFDGIETFPVDSTWRIEAVFAPNDPPKMIGIPTVLSTINEEPLAWRVHFKINGKTYQLDATGKMTDKELL